MFKTWFGLFVLLSWSSYAKSLRQDTDEVLFSDERFELRASTIPSGEVSTWRERAEKLNHEFQESILGKIPKNIEEQIGTTKFLLVISKDCVADGNFWEPNELKASTLEMCLRPEDYFNESAIQVFSHEVFHAVHYLIHRDEEAWIREGLAQWFSYRVVNRFNGDNYRQALMHSTTPLEGSFDLHQIVPEQYGHDFLFFFYLWNRCGGDDVIWRLAQGEKGLFGERGLEKILAKTDFPDSQKFCQTFKSLSLNFEIARAHNHEVYGKEASKDYVLVPTSHHFDVSKITASELKTRKSYQPILLAFDDRLNVDEVRFKIFWLHRRFPNEVSRSAPETGTAEWRELIVPTE